MKEGFPITTRTARQVAVLPQDHQAPYFHHAIARPFEVRCLEAFAFEFQVLLSGPGLVSASVGSAVRELDTKRLFQVFGGKVTLPMVRFLQPRR